MWNQQQYTVLVSTVSTKGLLWFSFPTVNTAQSPSVETGLPTLMGLTRMVTLMPLYDSHTCLNAPFPQSSPAYSDR